jgi:uncharacterized protein YbjT (DUF2867 family)
MAGVLVTGGTGFLGAHCLIQLLAAGHEARRTVRSTPFTEQDWTNLDDPGVQLYSLTRPNGR